MISGLFLSCAPAYVIFHLFQLVLFIVLGDSFLTYRKKAGFLLVNRYNY